MIVHTITSNKGFLIPVKYNIYKINGIQYMAIDGRKEKCEKCELSIDYCYNIMCYINKIRFIKICVHENK